MRTPSQYLPAALANLRARLMPDCAETMRHGGDVAPVTRVGSYAPDCGRDEDGSGDVVAEHKVLAAASSFPRLEYGEVVEVDGTARMVVEVKSDPARSTLKVSLSRELSACAVGRDSGADGRLRGAVPFRCVALQSGRDDDLVGARQSFDGAARVAWMLHVPRGEWPIPGDPQIGRRLVLSRRGCANASMTVRGAEFRNGVWRLMCAQDSRIPDWGS